MATIGFKGFGWILGLATVSPACYMVSSMVAAERGRVESVERAILQARKDIRALDTEFDTRANYTQLERWNGEVLALSAPRPEQFVSNDAQLAHLQMGGAEIRYAALVVPSAPATFGDGELPVPNGAAAARLETPAPAPQAAASQDAAPKPMPAVAAANPIVKRAIAAAKPQRVAMLDSDLLSDATLGDLASSARREGVKLR